MLYISSDNRETVEELNKHIVQIKKLCVSHGVKSLFAFGSVLRNELRPDSDIDMVVDIDDEDPFSYTDKYFDLKFNLEDLLGRKVDLLEAKAIRNRFFKLEIDRTKLQLYGG